MLWACRFPQAARPGTSATASSIWQPTRDVFNATFAVTRRGSCPERADSGRAAVSKG